MPEIETFQGSKENRGALPAINFFKGESCFIATKKILSLNYNRAIAL